MCGDFGHTVCLLSGGTEQERGRETLNRALTGPLHQCRVGIQPTMTAGCKLQAPTKRTQRLDGLCTVSTILVAALENFYNKPESVGKKVLGTGYLLYLVDYRQNFKLLQAFFAFLTRWPYFYRADQTSSHFKH